jgi:inorganic phosphate transporter, PiT family
VVTIPAAGTVAYAMYWMTQLPTPLAVLGIGAVLVAFGTWAVWAMMHTIHAKDVEAELLPEDVLAEPVPGHPHLQGQGPVA